MMKEQCWIYTGAVGDRGGGSPVRWTPRSARDIGWKKDGFWTIPEIPTGETTKLRTTFWGMSELLHAEGGQQAAAASILLHESAFLTLVTWEQLQFAISIISMAPPICLSSWHEWSIICAELIPAARKVNKKAIIKEKKIRIVSPVVGIIYQIPHCGNSANSNFTGETVMSPKDVCMLGSGGWPPKGNTDGHQLQNLISDTKSRIRAKNQLEGAAFSAEDIAQIRAAIKKKYSAVSSSAEGYFKYPVGMTGATLLDYDQALLTEIPKELLNSFCGVGNPFTIDLIEEGSTLLDIGCGAGFDLFVASRLVGDTGKVRGVDLTKEMVDKARANLAVLQVSNAEVQLVSSEQLPFADDTFDVVISNGVINLSPDKPRLFAEIYRVLKRGGRLQFADIILDKELPPHLAVSVESWSQWIGGAIPGGDQLTLMEKAGFKEVTQIGTTPIKTSEYTVGALFIAIKP